MGFPYVNTIREKGLGMMKRSQVRSFQERFTVAATVMIGMPVRAESMAKLGLDTRRGPRGPSILKPRAGTVFMASVMSVSACSPPRDEDPRRAFMPKASTVRAASSPS